MESVFAVILAGGSGTRFWPASRRLRPKQLLALGPSAPASLLQATVNRLEGLVDTSRIFVSTGAHLVEATRQQLPELGQHAFLAEPQARNTAPCIGWAAARVAREDPHGVVCVLPSDQMAADASAFRAALTTAIEAARGGRITTVGVVPSRPETGYGYIEAGEELAPGVRQTTRFVEKPDRATAEAYLASGSYLWNAGMFIFRAQDMLDAIAAHLPAMAEPLERLRRATPGSAEEARVVDALFANCESVSIDYGVMERQGDQAVVPADFGWSDLGSWESAWELAPRDAEGNAAPEGSVLVDSSNNLVVSAGKHRRTVALVGVDDLVVVETDDAILVLPRSRSQDVRQVVAALKERSDELT